MDMHNYLVEVYKEQYGEHINKDIAEHLVSDMAVTDGTDRDSGEKWSYHDAKELGTKMGVNFEKVHPCEWYLVLNMMYSDHFRTAKKHGTTDPTFFEELAYDWFYDVDGEDDKTFNYFMY